MASGRNESPSNTPEHGHGRIVALALLFVLVGRWVPPAHALTATDTGAAGADHAVQCLGALSGALRATPQSVELWKTSATLSWSIAVPPGCTTIRFYLNGQLVAPAGTMTVQPIANSTYSLKARYPGVGERAMGS